MIDLLIPALIGLIVGSIAALPVVLGMALAEGRVPGRKLKELVTWHNRAYEPVHRVNGIPRVLARNLPDYPLWYRLKVTCLVFMGKADVIVKGDNERGGP